MKTARQRLIGIFFGAAIVAGCGEHMQKKQESLVSPAERGTEAQKEPVGPTGHGEPASNRNR